MISSDLLFPWIFMKILIIISNATNLDTIVINKDIIIVMLLTILIAPKNKKEYLWKSSKSVNRWDR